MFYKCLFLDKRTHSQLVLEFTYLEVLPIHPEFFRAIQFFLNIILWIGCRIYGDREFTGKNAGIKDFKANSLEIRVFLNQFYDG